MRTGKIDEMKRLQYSNRYSCLRRLGEIYPDVFKVEVKYKGKSSSWDGNEIAGKFEIHSDQLIDFLIKCPNNSCTGIGIDLNSEVINALSKGIDHIAGEKECDGYEDEERYGNHKCGSILNYEITIDYRKNTL